MGLPFFERVVQLQKKYANGRTVGNSLQTNGTLLDDAWSAFLADNHFLVGLSIDGPRDLHDAFRVDKGGRPTWEKVMRGLRALKRHGVDFNTLSVVHRRNWNRAREVYDFLRENGSGFMQFIPLVERKPSQAERASKLDHAAPVLDESGLLSQEDVRLAMSDECAPPEGFGSFLCAVFDEWIRRDVGKVFVQQFDVALSIWCGHGAGLCVFEKHCGRALALEYDGSLYTCDHYVYPQFRLGNLNETPLLDMGNSPSAEQFGEAKAKLPQICRLCPVCFACNGDCPKHRFVRSNPGEPGVSYLCPSYKKFFSHIDPAMRRMEALLRAGRPPAEVMLERASLS